MKKLIMLCLVIGMAFMTSCSSKKAEAEKDDIRILMQDSTDVHGIKRMQVSKNEQNISFKGKEYHSYLTRVPNDSLPKVKSEIGDVFVDNEITLRLTRGSETIFSKTFTKRNFSSLIGEEFMRHSILEGMVYDKISPEGIIYAASVSYPQTDLYIPISIIITADGKMSMRKEELMEEIYNEGAPAEQ